MNGWARRVPGVLRGLAVTAVAAGVAYALLVLVFHARVPYPLCFAVVLVVVLGRQFTRAFTPPPAGRALVREDTSATVYGVPDRPFADVRRWEERLDLMRGDRDYYERVVRPAIAAVVDERLRVGHGVTRDEQPERSRELVGARVWDLLTTTQPRRPPSPGELADVIAEVEDL
ncbi:hypothetical protein [Actinopolymorpha singaporensis]|uniref:Uncharacterized protein n=1 Tax=Actinopolymorpha singaporensis TaxID=117157 RepID=A0A1H1LDV5_9ACTN|nr:hypothetical protein [Actinopolymorpha singaporensis]SDR72225.1 hypothetical protein SAMN04489717_0257 [Actinopolymorpha singaporensis]